MLVANCHMLIFDCYMDGGDMTLLWGIVTGEEMSLVEGQLRGFLTKRRSMAAALERPWQPRYAMTASGYCHPLVSER
jgi:hypothetical protein